MPGIKFAGGCLSDDGDVSVECRITRQARVVSDEIADLEVLA
jgi:hypothetical protein